MIDQKGIFHRNSFQQEAIEESINLEQEQFRPLASATSVDRDSQEVSLAEPVQVPLEESNDWK